MSYSDPWIILSLGLGTSLRLWLPPKGRSTLKLLAQVDRSPRASAGSSRLALGFPRAVDACPASDRELPGGRRCVSPIRQGAPWGQGLCLPHQTGGSLGQALCLPIRQGAPWGQGLCLPHQTGSFLKQRLCFLYQTGSSLGAVAMSPHQTGSSWRQGLYYPSDWHLWGRSCLLCEVELVVVGGD